jgi:hypothetical protein
VSFTCPCCGGTSHHPTDAGEGYCARCHDWTAGSPAERARHLASDCPEHRAPLLSTREHSRSYFREVISHHYDALVALSGGALFAMQAEVICRTLDVIDQTVDRETAFRVADALAARWVADVEVGAVGRALAGKAFDGLSFQLPPRT